MGFDSREIVLDKSGIKRKSSLLGFYFEKNLSEIKIDIIGSSHNFRRSYSIIASLDFLLIKRR